MKARKLTCQDCDASFAQNDARIGAYMYCPNCNGHLEAAPFTLGKWETEIPVPIENDSVSLKNYAILVYVLQAVSMVFVLTAIAAIIINYLKIKDVRRTWLESHFKWQIRTFWFTLLWTIIGTITSIVLIGIPILLATVIWNIYRIVKGWSRLMENKAMYVQG